MTGTARIDGVFRLTGRGWAVVLDDLSEDFLVKVGDFVTLEKGDLQLLARPILGVEFTDRRAPDGKMTGHVTLTLRDRHNDDLRQFEGGAVSITPA